MECFDKYKSGVTLFGAASMSMGMMLTNSPDETLRSYSSNMVLIGWILVGYGLALEEGQSGFMPMLDAKNVYTLLALYTVYVSMNMIQNGRDVNQWVIIQMISWAVLALMVSVSRKGKDMGKAPMIVGVVSEPIRNMISPLVHMLPVLDADRYELNPRKFGYGLVAGVSLVSTMTLVKGNVNFEMPSYILGMVSLLMASLSQ